MSKHVVSTLSADTRYVDWDRSGGINRLTRGVLVKGGAGVASRGKGDPVTPEGVITHISDDDARFLAEHKMFREHQEKGFVKIVNVAKDPDTVAQSMEKDAGSRPRNQKDVKDYAGKKGDDTLQAVTNKSK